MIERVTRHFGRLVFDRDVIVRAALRAYIETHLERIGRFAFPACDGAMWEGGLKRGAIYNDDGCGDYEVVAWTEAGVVGLACELGAGPIEQLGLSLDAVTGGPDDVRGAVPGLPAELELAFVMAVGMLYVGEEHGERQAGVGFWLHGDRVGGTLFAVHDPTRARGARRLAAWGLLHKGRLLPLSCESYRPRPGGIVTYHDRPQDAPAHAIMDAVVDRALKGPTEFTPAELETLLLPAPDPERVLAAQRRLQKVGITWPGSPEIPETCLPK
ncbi:hypothetical protein [Polyangium mundeleinium]|uniref:Uncharacterized protein n=1 Tax=Polyangium mundeleinium TaxID=2995306 RepID=A0ABT5F3I2_9BACT|nr:hypothetical protein [Polyangium mundeleinium]MDC0748673.1 hypothetical protein [Polyangium mundeleinium]